MNRTNIHVTEFGIFMRLGRRGKGDISLEEKMKTVVDNLKKYKSNAMFTVHARMAEWRGKRTSKLDNMR